MSAPRKKTASKKTSPSKAAPRTPAKSRSKAAAAAPADEESEAAQRAGSPPRPDQMNADVVAFITAIEDYKRQHQRPFPNWSEILEVVKSLGYVRTR